MLLLLCSFVLLQSLDDGAELLHSVGGVYLTADTLDVAPVAPVDSIQATEGDDNADTLDVAPVAPADSIQATEYTDNADTLDVAPDNINQMQGTTAAAPLVASCSTSAVYPTYYEALEALGRYRPNAKLAERINGAGEAKNY